MKQSHNRSKQTKAVTVRLPLTKLRRVMRALRLTTQTELLQSLLDEADERITSLAALRASVGVAGNGKDDFDDRLL